MTGYEFEDQDGTSWIWDPEYEVFISDEGEEAELDAFDFGDEEFEDADPEDEWDHAIASGVAELSAHLHRQLTDTEIEGVVAAAQEMGTTDVVSAYSAFRGAGGESQASDRAASKAEVAKVVGAPDLSTAEGRTKLMSEVASDIQAQQEAEEEGGEGG